MGLGLFRVSDAVNAANLRRPNTELTKERIKTIHGPKRLTPRQTETTSDRLNAVDPVGGERRER